MVDNEGAKSSSENKRGFELEFGIVSTN